MGITARDVVLGAAVLFAFPGALAVTDAACSEPGDLGSPTQQPVKVPATTARD